MLGDLTLILRREIIKKVLKSRILWSSLQEMVMSGVIVPLLGVGSVVWGTLLVAVRKWCVYSLYEKVLQVLENNHLSSRKD